MITPRRYTWRCPGGVISLWGNTYAGWREKGDTFVGMTRDGYWIGRHDDQDIESIYNPNCLPATPLACRLFGEPP